MSSDMMKDPVFVSVMTTFDAAFDAALKPVIHATNIGGGYGATGRLQFTAHEDKLLALGL